MPDVLPSFHMSSNNIMFILGDGLIPDEYSELIILSDLNKATISDKKKEIIYHSHLEYIYNYIKYYLHF